MHGYNHEEKLCSMDATTLEPLAAMNTKDAKCTMYYTGSLHR